MPSKYASGKHSIAECDRCGQRFKLVELKKLTIKTKQVSIKVCPECWEPDQPQLQLGMYPVNDPQAVREPRPDISYYASGVDDLGNISGGSRVFQWGWNPVGGASSFDTVLTPNYLIAVGAVGTVTISTT
jgi:NAD-dependent SIR2 family protein deacetylase